MLGATCRCSTSSGWCLQTERNMKLSELEETDAQEERVERPARMKPKAMEDLIDREVPEGSADTARGVEGHQVANGGSTLTWRADRGVFEAPTITAFLRL